MSGQQNTAGGNPAAGAGDISISNDIVSQTADESKQSDEYWASILADTPPGKLTPSKAGNPPDPSPRSFNLIRLSDVVEEKTEFLIYPYVPQGEVTLNAGAGGVGKTTFAVYIGAKVTRGGAILGDDTFRLPENVLFISVEESLTKTVTKRFRKAGADMSRVFTVNVQEDGIPEFKSAGLESLIKQSAARLIILDNLAAFMGSGVDAHRFNETRPIFTHLQRVAAQNNCAIMVICHLSKMQGLTAQDRISGSADIVNAVRSVIGVGYDPGDGADDDTRILCHIKSNLARLGDCIPFRWDDDFHIKVLASRPDLTADDVMNARRGGKQEAPEPTACMMFLTDMLSKGAVSAKEMFEATKANGFSSATVNRAKRIMGIISSKEDGRGGQWMWTLKDYHAQSNDNVDSLDNLTDKDYQHYQDFQVVMSDNLASGFTELTDNEPISF